MCSTVCGRREILRGIDALPHSITSSSSDLLSTFGDACSAPLSGIDPESTTGSFGCETDWHSLLHSTTSRNLSGLENRLLSIPKESSDRDTGSYISECSHKKPFLSLDSPIANKAAGTLACLKSFAVKGKPISFFRREGVLDYLPTLRGIHASEEQRRNASTRRRYVVSYTLFLLLSS